MKKYVTLALALMLIASCKKDTETTTETTITEKAPALSFDTKQYNQKTTLPCKAEHCTHVDISVPIAKGVPVVADSINKTIFNTVRGIVYFGEKPTNATSYEELMDSFIKSYDELSKKFPDEAIGWEGKINATVDYTSDNIIDVKVNNYMFTGGAHGYEGNRSLLLDAKTGKSLSYSDIFKDQKAFTAYAEKKFRQQFKIPEGQPINSTGMMFAKEVFELPQNIFFKQNGLLLYYNSYEIASYADGAKELILPYSEIEQYLKVK